MAAQVLEQTLRRAQAIKAKAKHGQTLSRIKATLYHEVTHCNRSRT